MNKLIFFLILTSLSCFAADEPSTVSTTKVDNDSFNPLESHWIGYFGFEQSKYDVPFEYTGLKQDFKPHGENIWGARVGYGGEIYLGAGFTATTKVEGYYMGTLFESTKGVDSSVAESYSFTKKNGQVFGGQFIQAFGYVIDFKTRNPIMDNMVQLTFEPFIEVGLGRARAYHRVNYRYDTGVITESYKHKIEDDINSQNVGIGFNLTSTTGYFLYLKANRYYYDVVKRKSAGQAQTNGLSEVSFNEIQKNVIMDPLNIYSLGGGYKF